MFALLCRSPGCSAATHPHCQEDKAFEPAVSALAKTKLVEAMQMHLLQRLRVPYMQRCVENIGASASVSSSMAVFRSISELLPPRPVGHDLTSRKSVLTTLETRFKVVTLFFDDLRRFKDDARTAFETVPVAQRNDAAVSAASRVPFLKVRLQHPCVCVCLIDKAGRPCGTGCVFPGSCSAVTDCRRSLMR